MYADLNPVMQLKVYDASVLMDTMWPTGRRMGDVWEAVLQAWP